MSEPYYQDDHVTLYHGDCLELADVWTSADVLVTDPPYGIHHTRHGESCVVIAGERRTGRASDRVLTEDDVAVRNSALVLWTPKPAIVFGSWRAPRPHGTRMRMIWDKNIVGMGGVGAWRPADEEIYIVGDWPNPKGGEGAESSVIRMNALRGNARPDHPTPKPVRLMEYLLSYSPHGLVADPFAGSGSTLVAAKNLGRRVVGVELEEKYCEIIAQRCSQEVLDFGGIA